MADPITIAISGLALGVSALNAWLTLFRRVTVKMTEPTVIFSGRINRPKRVGVYRRST